MASSFDHRKIRAAERSDALARAYRQIVSTSLQFPPIQRLRSQNLKTAVDTIRKRGSIPDMLKSFAALLLLRLSRFRTSKSYRI